MGFTVLDRTLKLAKDTNQNYGKKWKEKKKINETFEGGGASLAIVFPTLLEKRD